MSDRLSNPALTWGLCGFQVFGCPGKLPVRNRMPGRQAQASALAPAHTALEQ